MSLKEEKPTRHLERDWEPRTACGRSSEDLDLSAVTFNVVDVTCRTCQRTTRYRREADRFKDRLLRKGVE